jgi:hypothetical protein
VMGGYYTPFGFTLASVFAFYFLRVDWAVGS